MDWYQRDYEIARLEAQVAELQKERDQLRVSLGRVGRLLRGSNWIQQARALALTKHMDPAFEYEQVFEIIRSAIDAITEETP